MLETFKVFIKTLPPEYLVASTIATFLAFIFFLHFIKKELQEESRYIASNILINEDSINSCAKRLKEKIKPDTFFYKEYLNNTLNFLNQHLGELKIFSYKTWEKHFTYSLIYSTLFFYLIWLFGGSGQIGTLTFLPNENRLGISLFLIFEIFILYFTLVKTEQTTKFLSKQIPYFSRLSNVWQEILVVVVVVGGGVVVGGVVVGGVVVVVVGVVVVGVVGVGVVVGVVVGGVVVGGVVGVVGVVVGGVVVGGVVVGVVNPNTILYILFFLILPFINSIFDYFSMYFSRLFSYYILKTHKKWKIFLDVMIDAFIAILLLWALATTLFYVLEYANSFIVNEKLKIPIEFYRTELLSNPFNKEVIWITLMFASTLIPTLAHLVMGLYSLLALYIVKPHLTTLANNLIDLSKNEKDADKKYFIAKELALYEQSSILKIYMFIGVGIIIGFLIALTALLIKIGFNIL